MGVPLAAQCRGTSLRRPLNNPWFGIFRLGVWPDFFPGVQFAQQPEALEQFSGQMAPNTGPARSLAPVDGAGRGWLPR